MWISYTHAYVLSVSCLMQFGEGKKKYKHTQKLQPEVCRGLEAARGRQNPALAPAWVSQADFLSGLLGAASSACVVGRLAAQWMELHLACPAQSMVWTPMQSCIGLSSAGEVWSSSSISRLGKEPTTFSLLCDPEEATSHL